eukprot:4397002-Karenia_brevis.AAC.1
MFWGARPAVALRGGVNLEVSALYLGLPSTLPLHCFWRSLSALSNLWALRVSSCNESWASL